MKSTDTYIDERLSNQCNNGERTSTPPPSRAVVSPSEPEPMVSPATAYESVEAYFIDGNPNPPNALSTLHAKNLVEVEIHATLVMRRVIVPDVGAELFDPCKFNMAYDSASRRAGIIAVQQFSYKVVV